MEFCGRDQELQTLIDRWRLASDVNKPLPQVVVIAGEQGLGKTRLAMEFFKWLSVNEDVPEIGYWSDNAATIGSNLMVQPASHKGRLRDRSIPFLWWGLRVGDIAKENAVHGDILAENPEELARHLAALTLRSQFIRAKAKNESLKWLSFLGKTAVSDITGLGTFNEILDGIRRTRGEIADAIERETSASYFENQGDKRRESLNNVLLTTLQGLFDPKSNGYAGKPAVVLFDDAQFFMNDGRISSFAARLMHTSVVQKWPVMILVTHLRRELYAKEGPFAKIIDNARNSTGGLDKYGIPTGYLQSENYTTLDLKPVCSLDKAVSNALPGLRDDQVSQLASRVAGNPRHLEHIIKYIQTKPRFFENLDLHGALTEEGMVKAHQATESLVDTVVERLRSAPVDVQQAVCIASMFGKRFMETVVTAVAVRHIDWKSRDAIAQAINPYSWIHSDLPSQSMEFSDNLYFLAAQERRQDMHELADANALQKTIKAVVKEQYLYVTTSNEFRPITKSTSERLKQMGMGPSWAKRNDAWKYAEFVCRLAADVFAEDENEPEIEYEALWRQVDLSAVQEDPDQWIWLAVRLIRLQNSHPNLLRPFRSARKLVTAKLYRLTRHYQECIDWLAHDIRCNQELCATWGYGLEEANELELMLREVVECHRALGEYREAREAHSLIVKAYEECPSYAMESRYFLQSLLAWGKYEEEIGDLLESGNVYRRYLRALTERMRSLFPAHSSSGRSIPEDLVIRFGFRAELTPIFLGMRLFLAISDDCGIAKCVDTYASVAKFCAEVDQFGRTQVNLLSCADILIKLLTENSRFNEVENVEHIKVHIVNAFDEKARN